MQVFYENELDIEKLASYHNLCEKKTKLIFTKPEIADKLKVSLYPYFSYDNLTDTQTCLGVYGELWGIHFIQAAFLPVDTLCYFFAASFNEFSMENLDRDYIASLSKYTLLIKQRTTS